MSVVDSITAADAMEQCSRDRAVLVDARPQVIRHQGSLPGAVVVDPGEVHERFRPTPSGNFPIIGDPNTDIAVVAARSEAPVIAEKIADLGYRNVHYIDGGFRAMHTVSGV